MATYKPALDIACYIDPRNGAEARFSVPYVVATALVHGSVRMAAYEPARLNDPATRALMSADRHSRWTRRSMPDSRVVALHAWTSCCTDGRRFSHLQPDRKGDPELPLSDAELGEQADRTFRTGDR